MRPEQEGDRVHKAAQEAIEEARMVLPGIQALFGFQLIAAFNNRFVELTPGEKVTHFVALLLVAVSIALIMTPAAYHRIVEPGTVSMSFVRLASRLIASALLPLVLALAAEAYLVGRIIGIGSVPSGVVGGAVLLLCAGLWFGFPLAVRKRSPTE